MDVQDLKNRFGIIGNSPLINRAIDIARQVAPTDISVLISGESGSGKEVFSQIIHQLSSRKHGPFIAVNCGAIPEGTIDSELFGHEKGSFTGATDARKGYFEVVNGGTIFLDEVAELPLGTQARLLRVLEAGEYIRVGSSKVQKTSVRIIAATNVDVYEAVLKGKFREDLYYRLNTVPLKIPALKERKEDIYLLFRKFMSDFTEKYHTPAIQLTEEAKRALMDYSWPGNVRQLKNIAEQIAVLEKNREITVESLSNYVPFSQNQQLPMRLKNGGLETDFSERDILYKVLFDMRKDIADLRKAVSEIMQSGTELERLPDLKSSHLSGLLSPAVGTPYETSPQSSNLNFTPTIANQNYLENYHEKNFRDTDSEEVEETLSLGENENELIRKALKKHKGKRKSAASELGISERTLYRKIKEYNL